MAWHPRHGTQRRLESGTRLGAGVTGRYNPAAYVWRQVPGAVTGFASPACPAPAFPTAHCSERGGMAMATARLAGWVLLVVGASAAAAVGQQAVPGSTSAPGGIAATVNGQPITEKAVERGLRRLPPDRQTQARNEILNFLIDTALVDQYLDQARIEIDPKDAETR